eukprot:snap_masked-scaffold_21-processed-gene-4.9-mRNA-1 protein AED:0.06 eAED:0.07 QI:0/-1/0/1/-1/1/1/0/220
MTFEQEIDTFYKEYLNNKEEELFKKETRKCQKWNSTEDALLKKFVAQYGIPNWVLISQKLQTKTAAQAMQRWQQVLRPGIRKGSWTPEEDSNLKKLIFEKFGRNFEQIKNWKFVEGYMNGRTAKQCRERWILSLDPSINRGPWNKEEDEQIVQLQMIYGNKWSLIRKELKTNRTQNAVKLRYKRLAAKGTNVKIEKEEFQVIKRRKIIEEDFLEIAELLL